MLADADDGGDFSGKPANGFGSVHQQALAVLFLTLLFVFRHVSGYALQIPGLRGFLRREFR